jgi:hypothetical protein
LHASLKFRANVEADVNLVEAKTGAEIAATAGGADADADADAAAAAAAGDENGGRFGCCYAWRYSLWQCVGSERGNSFAKRTGLIPWQPFLHPLLSTNTLKPMKKFSKKKKNISRNKKKPETI